ncbi:GH1 family beta-glucosidase [Celeribacter indicus]|uniref:Beta-glucosidase n=1 Tax=Celeribacter indicus TaxID=1208324 RepID=A0A0B5DTX4_9RHOB|nr:GH1 family beta-glucosidase [Celeribacter indicus]AJE46903.1 Beta-glucosidase [Celeribacter indicus]SDW79048.1 beta-glucosidase [Celeribacter indicus]
MTDPLTRADFPEGFLFGAATAAYQVEGHRFGGAGPTHWDSFAAGPGNVVHNEDGATACDQYHRYAEDLDLLAAGNFDAYRFSTSWARILPEGRGAVNEAGLDYYDRLTDALLARGLAPVLTLYHWDMPSALADLGGWTNPDVHNWFGDFAEIVDARIGDRMERIATINEPWCVAWLSHFLGGHAPGLRDIRAGARAMHHVLKAHGEAMTRLRGRGRDGLGIVLNFEDAQPASDAPGDLEAAAIEDALRNRWFIEAITRGRYPAEALEGLAPHLPEGWEEDLSGQIGAPLDWLGVNYYTRNLHAHDPEATGWPPTRTAQGHRATTQMGWEIFPEGLHRILTRLARDHVGGLPVVVTENGMAWDDRVRDGRVDDPERCAYIRDHLAAMHRARADGVNLAGFFYWSLLDNYEWAFGYEKRFGIVHVDFETLQRTPKASYHMLKTCLERT